MIVQLTPTLRLVTLQHPDGRYTAWQLERTWQSSTQAWQPLATHSNLRVVLRSLFDWLMKSNDVKANLQDIEEVVEKLQQELE